MVTFCYVATLGCGFDWVLKLSPLFAGVVGFVIAFLQLGISRQQLGISKRQVAIVENQKAQEVATAQLALERVFVPLFKEMHILQTIGSHRLTGEFVDGHRTFAWVPTMLERIGGVEMDWDVDRLGEAAVVAYPAAATTVVQMLQAAKTSHDLAEKYAEAPFETGALADAAQAALNQFVRSAHKLNGQLGRQGS